MKLSQIIKVAYQESKKALKKNEVPVGAVIFNDKEIISKAHNLVIKNNDPLAHAEYLAIKKAAKKLKTNLRVILDELFILARENLISISR